MTVGVSARPATGPHTTPAPTAGSAVLVHGTWGNPEDWSWVRQLVGAAGVHVVTPDLPSHRGATAGLQEDADLVRAAFRGCTAPVVAVGWSYGGAVITAAADVDVDVSGLLDVGCVPRDGGFVESLDWLDDLWWRTEEAGRTFPEDVRLALGNQPRRPATRRSCADAQLGAAWRATPTTVLVGTSDFAVTGDDLSWLSAHPDLDVRVVDCDHFILFRSPALVAEAVLDRLRGAPRGPHDARSTST